MSYKVFEVRMTLRGEKPYDENGAEEIERRINEYAMADPPFALQRIDFYQADYGGSVNDIRAVVVMWRHQSGQAASSR